MINFSDKTYKNLLNAKLQMIPNSLDKSEGSMIWTAIAPNSYELSRYYEVLLLMQLQGSWKTASGEALENWCAIRSVYRREATPTIRVGTFNVEIPEGTRFSTIDGGIIFVSGARIESEQIQYQMTCEVAGTIGNNYSGDLLAIDYVNGLNYAYLGDILVAGEEAETDEELRVRFELSMKQMAFGGNLIAYKEKIEGIDGVGLCQVYPADQYEGGSTALCVIVDSQYRPVSQFLIDEVQDIICPKYNGEITNGGYGFAPIGAKITIATGTEFAINVECTLQVSSGQPSDYQTQAEEKISEYIKEAMSKWATPVITNEVNYNITIFRAKVIQYLLEIPNVVNVTNLTLNGADADITLIETGATQRIAVLGSVVLNG